MSHDDSTAPRPTDGQAWARPEHAPVVPTLVQAFAHDPVANYLFPDAAARKVGMAHVFRMAARSASTLGAIDVIPPDHAAALWLRPEHPQPGFRQWLQTDALTTPFVVGWRATRRMLHYEHFVGECRLRLMAGRPHWYLFAIGIQPGCQGRGLGSRLLETGRRRASAGGFPCYLETSNERNLAFYQKNGFAIVGRHPLPGADLTVWSLALESAPGC